jgi:predicted RNase H-like nuclease
MEAKLLLQSVSNNGMLIKTVEEQTLELCKAAFKENPKCFKFCDFQDEEMCIDAVNYSPAFLEYVKEQTPEICLQAFNKKNNIIIFKLMEYQHEDACKIMIQRNIKYLQYIKNPTVEICTIKKIMMSPETFQYLNNCSEELLRGILAFARNHNYDITSIYKNIPYKNKELDYIAVSFKPECLAYVNEQTEELYNLAKINGRNLLQYIENPAPYMFKGLSKRGIHLLNAPQEFIRKNIKQDVYLLLLLDKITFEDFKPFIRYEPSLIKCVKNISIDQIKEAIRIYPYIFIHVEQTPEIILHTLSINGKMLKYIDDQTDEYCMQAIASNYSSFKYVKNKTYPLCLFAIQCNATNIMFVPKQFHTAELCEIVILSNPDCHIYIDNVPDTIVNIDKKYLLINKSPELIFRALEKDVNLLQYIKKTKEVVEFAIEKHGLNCVPYLYTVHDLCLVYRKLNNYDKILSLIECPYLKYRFQQLSLAQLSGTNNKSAKC